VGARPQFIKLAPLAKILNEKFRHLIVHSGQHYDRMMSNIFFDQLNIPKADYNLLVGSGNHSEMTGKIMMRFENLLAKLQPEMVLVYGDTNSTLAAALAAVKLNIPVGHIEAGLRSYRRDMPEEINRLLTDQISSLLFCPTPQSIKNLKKEGIKNGIIHSGDLMHELINSYKHKISANRIILKKFGVAPKKFILLTLHRAANVDDRNILGSLVDIICAIKKPIIFPIHPRTAKNLRKFGLKKKIDISKNIFLTEPLSYLDNLSLIYNAYAVMTDSGGMQKESVFLGTPCLTLRDETEWTETLKLGNHLVGLSSRKISRLLADLPTCKNKAPYLISNGKPSEIIATALSKFLEDS
jgi:UDP-N-acetylglucosamine 2-epimerase